MEPLSGLWVLNKKQRIPQITKTNQRRGTMKGIILFTPRRQPPNQNPWLVIFATIGVVLTILYIIGTVSGGPNDKGSQAPRPPTIKKVIRGAQPAIFYGAPRAPEMEDIDLVDRSQWQLI